MTVKVGVFVLAAIGIAFWAGSQRESPTVPTAGTAGAAVTRREAPRPAEYAVALRVSPVDAWINVDDQAQVTGALARSFPRDGVSHRVTVRAAGYVTETFEFSGATDRTVTLARDPSALAPVPAAATPDPGAPSPIIPGSQPATTGRTANRRGGSRPGAGPPPGGACVR